MEEEKLENVNSPGAEKPEDENSPGAEKPEDENSLGAEKPEDENSPEAEKPKDENSPGAEKPEDENSPGAEKLENEPPATPPQPENPPADVDRLAQIQEKLESIDGSEQRLFSEVREMHKLYHTEFAGRLQAMQSELEYYHEMDKGRIFDQILASIAGIYADFETLPEQVEEPKAKKKIENMLENIEGLLKEPPYGVEKLRSEPGEKRNPRHSRVLNSILTDDPEKHDTIAKVCRSGFHIGNRTVVPEQVDIYIYKESAAGKAMKKEQTIETGDTPDTK